MRSNEGTTMQTPILLPELGVGDEQIRVSGWFVEPGDSVEVGDRVVEVLLPGMTFDVAAPGAGVFLKSEKFLDAVVSTGDVLGWIES